MVLMGLIFGFIMGLIFVLFSFGLIEVCVRYSMVVGEIKEFSGKVYKGVLSVKNIDYYVVFYIDFS